MTMWGARPSRLLIIDIVLLVAVVSSPLSSEARPYPGQFDFSDLWSAGRVLIEFSNNFALF